MSSCILCFCLCLDVTRCSKGAMISCILWFCLCSDVTRCSEGAMINCIICMPVLVCHKVLGRCEILCFCLCSDVTRCSDGAMICCIICLPGCRTVPGRCDYLVAMVCDAIPAGEGRGRRWCLYLFCFGSWLSARRLFGFCCNGDGHGCECSCCFKKRKRKGKTVDHIELSIFHQRSKE